MGAWWYKERDLLYETEFSGWLIINGIVFSPTEEEISSQAY